jgi:hypothetical protein
MFCAPMMILGIAIWRLTPNGDPAAAVQLPPVPPVPTVVAPLPAIRPPARFVPPVPVASERPWPAIADGRPAAVAAPVARGAGLSRRVTTPVKVIETASALSVAGPPAPVPAAAPSGDPPPSAAMTSAAAAPRLAGVPLIPPGPAAPAAQITPPQLERSVVDWVFAGHSRALSTCDSHQELHGDITVRFKVDASGTVSQPQISTVIKNPKLIACILRAIQTWQFPQQGPAGAQGSYTLSFR